ncbi:MAG: tetratricopeptide repeat protein, partial [Chloroflexi bacterium]|nr:tetratricopeptide repeat protein [Chloroflexota bacterium]
MTPDDFFTRGLSLHQQERLEDAQSCYAQALARDPNHFGSLLCAGVIFNGKGKFDLGAELLRAAVNASPTSAEARACLADALVGLGQAAEAINQYRAAIGFRPDFPEAQVSLGNALSSRGDVATAMQIFRDVLSRHPDMPQAENNLAGLLERTGAVTEAVAMLRRLLDRQPTMVEAHVNLANALRTAGDIHGAIEHSRVALQLDATCPEAHLALGNALEEQGYREDAAAAFRQALRLRPDFPEAHVNLGNSLLMVSRYNDALSHYRLALMYQPDNLAAHLNAGAALEELGRLDEAAAAFQFVIEREPANYKALRGAAIVQLKLAGTERAVLLGRAGFSGGIETYAPFGPDAPPILVLRSALGGNGLSGLWIDHLPVARHDIFVEFFDRDRQLPQHVLTVNSLSDADISRAGLEAAVDLIGQANADVVNRPEHVLRTGRAEMAKRLSEIPGVVAPRTRQYPKRALLSDEARATLAKDGFCWPLLLRSRGFHTGRFFLKVDSSRELAATAASLPGDELLAIEYINCADSSGLNRKYRVMIVDERLYPLHLAISHMWKVHYFSAEMDTSEAFRQEDQYFLERMPEALGSAATACLLSIASTLQLDFAGIDFGFRPDGAMVVFEANSAMVVPDPPAGDKWDYRRQPVGQIVQAIRTML